jgi:hypothetical protein
MATSVTDVIEHTDADAPDRAEETANDTGIQSFLVTFIIRRFDPEVDERSRAGWTTTSSCTRPTASWTRSTRSSGRSTAR